jgi:hypothetical protein
MPDAKQLDFARLYSLGEKFERGAFRAHDRDRAIAEPWALVRGAWTPAAPITFVQDSGGTPHDLIGTTHAIIDLASTRFVETLEAGGFTGWRTFGVEVFRKDGTELDGYHGFAVTGRAGPVDHSRSEPVWVEPILPSGQRHQRFRGLYFDPDTWDGSDIFFPGESAITVLGEDVKEALEAAGVTNVEFQRLTERLLDLTADERRAAGFEPEPLS